MAENILLEDLPNPLSFKIHYNSATSKDYVCFKDIDCDIYEFMYLENILNNQSTLDKVNENLSASKVKIIMPNKEKMKYSICLFQIDPDQELLKCVGEKIRQVLNDYGKSHLIFEILELDDCRQLLQSYKDRLSIIAHCFTIGGEKKAAIVFRKEIDTDVRELVQRNREAADEIQIDDKKVKLKTKKVVKCYEIHDSDCFDFMRMDQIVETVKGHGNKNNVLVETLDKDGAVFEIEGKPENVDKFMKTIDEMVKCLVKKIVPVHPLCVQSEVLDKIERDNTVLCKVANKRSDTSQKSKHSIKITIVEGSLEETKVDVLACAMSDDLDLKHGTVTKAILKKAGKNLQLDLFEKYPDRLGYGEIACVKANKLDCQNIYFGILNQYNEKYVNQGEEEADVVKRNIHHFMMNCLTKADHDQRSTIAFPILGTGKMRYPLTTVVDQMFETVELFKDIYDVQYVQEVNIVVYPGDEEALQVLKNKELKLGQSQAEPDDDRVIVTIVGGKDNVLKARDELQRLTQNFKMDATATTTVRQKDVEKRMSSSTKCPIHTNTSRMALSMTTDTKAGRSAIKGGSIKHMSQTGVTGTDVLDDAAVSPRVSTESLEPEMKSETLHLTEHQFQCLEAFYPNTLQQLKETGVSYIYKTGLVLTGKIELVAKMGKKIAKAIEEMNKKVQQDRVTITDSTATKRVDLYEYLVELNTNDLLCVPDVTNKEIIISGFDFEKITQVKHKLEIMLGHKQITSRDHRKLQTETDVSVDQGMQQLNIHRSDPALQRQFSWGSEARGLELFRTAEGIFVRVYAANLLKAPVDCIVNAANGNLSHGAGLAKFIAKAAGRELERECHNHIKYKRELFTGEVFASTAGDLQFDCVIHAVGPVWSDYDPHKKERVEKCETDLCYAVVHSLELASKKGLKSIAFPAISSSIYGCPRELCAVQYVSAIVHHSMYGSKLEEIHFVDKNEEMVRLVAKVCKETLTTKKEPSWYKGWKKENILKKQLSATGKTGAESQRSQNPSYPAYLSNKQIKKQCTLELASPEQKVEIYMHNILELQNTCDMVVCSVDIGSPKKGIIARLLEEAGGQAYANSKVLLIKNAKRGDVLVCPGFKTGFKWISHAVLWKKNKGTSDEELEEKRNKIYEDIFREMKARDCKKLALPLLSTGDGGAQVAHFANCFIENVYSFSKSNKDYKFTIHVVNRDQGKIDECVATVRRSIDYIKKNEQAAKGARQKTRNSADIKPTGRGRPTQQNSASQSSKQTKPSNRQIAGAVSSLENPRLNGKEDTVKKPGDETEVTARDPKESDFKTKKTESKTIKESENEEENCVICMDKFDNPKTLKCGHRFCTKCIDASFKQKAACPICGTVCGTITGNQPRGEMLIKNQKDQYCAGYESYGRIEITYRFSDGVQGRDHPSPGKPYRGITRTAYLPDNKNGRIICVLLQIAFDRKLVFTIGNSRTTGKEGVITWNDIHHKTDPKPNSQFGYPDPTYLSRVLDELKAKGVTQDDITSVGGHK